MSKRFTESMVSANALTSGQSVWLTETGEWSHRPSEGEIFTDPERANAALAEAEADAGTVVGAYLAPVPATGRTGSLRETIRQNGPTIAYRPQEA